MAANRLHRFERDNRHFVVDPESCFCFECDAISWDVLEHYPDASANRIVHLLRDRHSEAELQEVISELEWLRSTKSILKPTKIEDLPKRYETTPGFREMHIALGAGESTTWDIARDAVSFFLGRAAADGALMLTLTVTPALLANTRLNDLIAAAFRQAGLAGRTLTVVTAIETLVITKIPQALASSALGVRLHLTQCDSKALSALADALKSLPALAKFAAQGNADARAQIVMRPTDPAFGDTVEALEKLGFTWIDLDMDAAFAGNAGLDAAKTFDALRSNAEYYANRLLRHKYFRVDPIAEIFWRIYNGLPEARHDPAAVNAVAVNARGELYPSRLLLNNEAYKLGTLADAKVNSDIVCRFEKLGAVGVSVCKQCWARNLCGGGNAAIHAARTGDILKPDPTWCDAKRAWCEAAVSAFNLLSAQGANFNRVYQQLDAKTKPSLFTLAKAAFRMSLGLRPIEDSDAELLAKWENWNESAYFLFNESGLLISNTYDREMDALHPRGLEQEFMLVRKDGTPMGLLKVRPEKWTGTATAFVYLRAATDYAERAVRRSFATILDEAAGQQALRRLMIPVGPFDSGLADFLEACGFAVAGTQREGLFLHGHYHDVTLYSRDLAK